MESYDGVYREPRFYWGREPNGLGRRALELLQPSGRPGLRAVDLGCGEGRDLIHFARHGLDATGVDISRPGLAKAARWAAAEGLAVQLVAAGLDQFRLNAPVDLIYSSGTLTFVSPRLRAEIFDHYKAHTRIGGLNAFNAFVEKPFLPTPPDWGRDEHFFRSGELFGFYWDWEIVECSEIAFDCTSGGVPHRHAMDTLIARRVR